MEGQPWGQCSWRAENCVLWNGFRRHSYSNFHQFGRILSHPNQAALSTQYRKDSLTCRQGLHQPRQWWCHTNDQNAWFCSYFAYSKWLHQKLGSNLQQDQCSHLTAQSRAFPNCNISIFLRFVHLMLVLRLIEITQRISLSNLDWMAQCRFAQSTLDFCQVYFRKIIHLNHQVLWSLDFLLPRGRLMPWMIVSRDIWMTSTFKHTLILKAYLIWFYLNLIIYG